MVIINIERKEKKYTKNTKKAGKAIIKILIEKFFFKHTNDTSILTIE